MQVFVSEYVCGGAWPEERIETSLAREGRAMLTALVEDLSRISGVRVVTTWDARLGECPLRGDVRIVASAAHEEAVFRDLVRECDFVWIIAPETNRRLEQRCSLFWECNGQNASEAFRRLVGPWTSSVMLCADKLMLDTFARIDSIRTPDTAHFDPHSPSLDRWRFPIWPVVIKPRDGAGSQNTFFVQTKEDLRYVRTELKHVTQSDAFLQQAYIPGKALSVALLIAADGSVREVLPVAEQLLSDDGRFTYLGGRIPADISTESALAVQQLAMRACRLVGVTGYVGCDIVLTDTAYPFKPFDRAALSGAKLLGSLPQGEPVLIEINPRLTTSYLGYRLLTDDNIPARLLDANSPRLRWKPEPVTFTVRASADTFLTGSRHERYRPIIASGFSDLTGWNR